MQPKTKKYRVKRGDSLWKIAQSQYGDPKLWPAIAKGNRIKQPNLILVGQTLDLPAAQNSRSSSGSPGTATSPPSNSRSVSPSGPQAESSEGRLADQLAQHPALLVRFPTAKFNLDLKTFEYKLEGGPFKAVLRYKGTISVQKEGVITDWELTTDNLRLQPPLSLEYAAAVKSFLKPSITFEINKDEPPKVWLNMNVEGDDWKAALSGGFSQHEIGRKVTFESSRVIVKREIENLGTFVFERALSAELEFDVDLDKLLKVAVVTVAVVVVAVAGEYVVAVIVEEELIVVGARAVVWVWETGAAAASRVAPAVLEAGEKVIPWQALRAILASSQLLGRSLAGAI